MSLLKRLFESRSDAERLQPLYNAIVAEGRNPAWYRHGQVPDTIDGRFDMIATILSLVLIRLEHGEAKAKADSVLLTELFIADMEANIRQLGTGDPIVGKRIGQMMGAVGGRLGAYREALASGSSLEPAVRRNIFHDNAPSDDAVAWVSKHLQAFHESLQKQPVESILDGDLR